MYTVKRISNGMIAGLIAGILVSFFLILNGMELKIGSLFGVPNPLGGLITHLLSCLLGGIIFALFFDDLIHSWTSALLTSVLLSLSLWLIVPMTLIPTLSMNSALFAKWSFAGFLSGLNALIGYLGYGFVFGISYFFLKKGKLHSLKRPARIRRKSIHSKAI